MKCQSRQKQVCAKASNCLKNWVKIYQLFDGCAEWQTRGCGNNAIGSITREGPTHLMALASTMTSNLSPPMPHWANHWTVNLILLDLLEKRGEEGRGVLWPIGHIDILGQLFTLIQNRSLKLFTRKSFYSSLLWNSFQSFIERDTKLIDLQLLLASVCRLNGKIDLLR